MARDSAEWLNAMLFLERKQREAMAQNSGVELDPEQLLELNQALQNFCQKLPDKEALCRSSPDIAGVSWDEALTVVGSRLTEQVATDRAKGVVVRVEEPTPEGVVEVVLRAVEVRRRLGAIISGNGSAPSTSSALRQAILGRRYPRRSRAAYEADFDLIIESVEKLEAPPTPVIAFMHKVRAVRQELHDVRPLPKGQRMAETPIAWSEATVKAAWLVYATHGEALSWILAAAELPRTADAAQKLVLQRRQYDREPPPVSEPVPAPEIRPG